MNFETHERTQYIGRSLQEVAAYLSEVENLPEWNRFFVATVATEGDRTVIATPFGLVRTRVELTREGDEYAVVINSLVRGREEQARMRLREELGMTVLQFQLSLPVSMPAEAAEEMLAGLETNLETLAVILEHEVELAPACA